MTSYVVDRAAVEAEVSRRRTIQQTSYARWVTAKLVMSLAAFYAVALIIWLLRSAEPLSTLSSWNIGVFFGVPAFMALFVTWMASRTLFRAAALDPDRLAAEIQTEMDRLTGPHWPMRTLLAGAALAAAAGVPLAIVLWVTRSPIATSGTVASLMVFVAGMLLWATFMAFVIRWASLYLYRKLVRRAE